MGDFEPKIIAFACNWCSYAGADLAGVSRIQYPPTTRVIRVMCSGRVSPMFVLEAFRNGADGVLVTGCHPGDCHYIAGNEKAVQHIEVARSLMALLGIETQRVRLEWISAAEGARFAEVVTQFTDCIRALGATLPVSAAVCTERAASNTHQPAGGATLRPRLLLPSP